jgi:hypothetical protein
LRERSAHKGDARICGAKFAIADQVVGVPVGMYDKPNRLIYALLDFGDDLSITATQLPLTTLVLDSEAMNATMPSAT